MNKRNAKQMVTDNLEEMEDATEAMLIIVHADGTIGLHSTTDRLHQKLGMVRYAETVIEQQIREQPDVKFEEPAWRPN